MFARNQCFEMTCESFGQDAQGVCRHEGIAVFVPGLLPGERALVRIVKPEKRYAFGRMEKLLERSPDRTEPFCPCLLYTSGPQQEERKRRPFSSILHGLTSLLRYNNIYHIHYSGP